ncbi:hypothetical protein ABT160_42400 [Streptomyces sp. NPDC001941]|uniref:hypothetical protein n=1 Tax=Streptomyces sp. NPDC001941 TaxID=3154659 RepID=UPI003325519B
MRTLTVGLGGKVTEIFHQPACPQWALEQIYAALRARTWEDRHAWARRVFPVLRTRLIQAAAALPADSDAVPFAQALADLVQAQSLTSGSLSLPQWNEILHRHFPPPPGEHPGPGPVPGRAPNF